MYSVDQIVTSLVSSLTSATKSERNNASSLGRIIRFVQAVKTSDRNSSKSMKWLCYFLPRQIEFGIKFEKADEFKSDNFYDMLLIKEQN